MQVRHTVAMAARMHEMGFSRFRLLLVGDGPWTGELRAMLEAHGLEDRTEITGWVHPSKIPGLLNAIDVMPLLEEDPHGGSCVREAMATGSVVLSVDGVSGTQRSFITDDVSGVLVGPERFVDDAARACISLATDPDRRARLGRSARTYVEEHMSFDRAASVFENGCRRVLRAGAA